MYVHTYLICVPACGFFYNFYFLVSMQVCMYVCMYACTNMYVLSMYVCMYVCMHAYDLIIQARLHGTQIDTGSASGKHVAFWKLNGFACQQICAFARSHLADIFQENLCFPDLLNMFLASRFFVTGNACPCNDVGAKALLQCPEEMGCIHFCEYVCMYVCTYVCIYVCMYVCMHVCMYVCMYVHMYVCMYVCMYVFVRAHNCQHVFL